MIADVDDLSVEARSAIVEHAKNLSGGNSEQSRNTVKSGDCAPPAQFPSESGHWYCPKTGHQVELPPRTQTRTALKRGYVPGVTTITKIAHKEAIQRWMVNRAIKFTSGILREDPGSERWFMSDDCLVSEVWQLLNADSDAITGRGKELHAAIELYAQNKYSVKWDEHICNVRDRLEDEGILLGKGNTEHSFATSRYGGKIDWRNDEWLLDFKTKPRIEDGKKLAYPEHAQQLAAYASGLSWNKSSEWPFNRRCANVFIGVEDAKVVFHEWNEKDLLKGWRKFEALLGVWWSDYL